MIIFKTPTIIAMTSLMMSYVTLNVPAHAQMPALIDTPYTVAGKTYYPAYQPHYDHTGSATWSGKKFQARPTASGELFNRHGFTAAHPTLPMNSLVRVTNVTNGKSIHVRINDRGPFFGGHIIDLSEAAAQAISLDKNSQRQVRVQFDNTQSPRTQDKSLLPQPTDKLQFELQALLNVQTQAQNPIPAAPQDNNHDTVLIIKGPIHMAKSTNRTSKPGTETPLIMARF